MGDTAMTATAAATASGVVEDRPRKAVKRKRAVSVLAMTKEEMETRIRVLNEEMKGLFGYFKEMAVGLREFGECGGSLNGAVAVLMEESDLPLSRLVDEIHAKLKEKVEMGASVGAVKSAVLFVGQRVMYGIPNLDADVLEDQNEDCLWCWETRDVKLLPKYVRGILKIRRTCRKKIHERITAVSAMLTTLQQAESDSNFAHDVVKASEKLGKVLSEADIRVLMESLLKKNGTEIVEKDAKREEKLLMKQLERNKREAEKEKKRMDRELEKEKEKEQKRLQEEAEKDEKRRDKEESEMRKQLRKQQDDAEKEQRRRQKEEAELKKQLALQKQASIMQRFLKKSKTTSFQNDQSSSRVTTSDSLNKKSGKELQAVTQSMDCALSSFDELGIDDLRKSHLTSWRNFGHSIRSNRNQHWGKRKKPKTELFKELKLSNSKDLTRAYELSIETLDGRSCITDVGGSPDVKKCKRSKQLLQFDKSHRPAFYGIWPKKSLAVRPCQPLTKDPDLDYDVDSDEEWEEEDPGESLSDCDKDDEEDKLEESSAKVDDDEDSEDGFFVPDGYLSEDEGIEVDRMEVDLTVGETKCSQSSKQELESVESCALLRQQKHLHNLTEHALRKNHPLIVLNLMHEKNPLLTAENLSGTSKMEQTCLQALSMRAFHGDLVIEISIDGVEDEDQEACLSNSRSSTTPVPTVSAILDSDLPTIVSVIQSSKLGMNRVLESLQQKFPDIPKSQLRNKVREISDYSYSKNCWKVKKDILIKLGLPVPPDRITSFFSKRCLPPDGKNFNPNETSPLSLKPGSAVQDQQGCTYNDQ
ncbi:hypothetical protein Dsin_022470 [Dipteronia sinensis]|uniref:Chromatin assembly factor 1 subunit FAS1 n=1 Tax=Dipteronia sinensis TaxID=43782 RepID=A0AAE0A203_9ROSI|nr:hypothetical protein Dsin_022470 [Dipteronia sinensis]